MRRAVLVSLAALCLAGCLLANPEPALRFSNTDFERAQEHFDAARLRSALEEIAAWHGSQSSGLALRGGLSKEELDAIEQELDCHLPEELRLLWQMHDGEDTGALTWYHRFLPAQDAIAEWRAVRSYPYTPWRRQWIPVFHFQEEWYFVECSGTPRAASPVGHFFIEDEPRLVYLSLTAMLETTAAGMREGVLRWDPAGVIEGDVTSIAAIHARFNAGASFPYYMPPQPAVAP